MSFYKALIFGVSTLAIIEGYAGGDSPSMRDSDEDVNQLTKTIKKNKMEYENSFLNLPQYIKNEIFAQLDKRDHNSLSLTCKLLNEDNKEFLQTMAQRLAVIFGQSEKNVFEGNNIAKIILQYNPSLYKDKFAESFVKQDYISTLTGSEREKLLFKLSSARVVKTATLTDMFWDRHKQAYSNLSDGEKAAVQHMLAAQERSYFHTNKTQQNNIVNLCKNKVDEFINGGYEGYKFFGDKAWDQTTNGVLVVTQAQLDNPQTQGALESFFQANNNVSLLLDLAVTINVNQLKIANIKNLIITNAAGDITQIPDSFLEFSKIKTIDMRGMTKVTTIGNNFMSHCKALIEASFNFPSLTTIDDLFMSCCKALTKASFNFPSLEKIGNSFMRRCEALTEASFNFPSLTTIGNSFMRWCEELTEASFNFPSLTTIGDDFMSSCESLTEASLNFPSLTTIGNSFMSHCKALIEASFNFPSLKEIGNNFMSFCESLIEASFNFPSLTTIDDLFMSYCKALIEASFNFPSLTTIGNNFMRWCEALTEASFNFPSLTTIGNSFMSHCKELIEASFNFPSLTTIGNSFMFLCEKLKLIDWPENLRAKDVDIRGFLEGTTILEDDRKKAYKMITGKDW